MSFYYGSSKPPKDEQPGGIRDALAITWVVLKTLALPLGLLFGGIAYLVLLFFLFAANPLFGLAGILVVVAAFVGRGVWEWKHPPHLD